MVNNRVWACVGGVVVLAPAPATNHGPSAMWDAWTGVAPGPLAEPEGAATPAAGPGAAKQAPQGEEQAQKPARARQYLAVPYAECGEAKAAGALWDKAAKSWYAGPRADMAKLERWNPENVSTQQGPAMTPREEFAEAMKAAGLQVGTVKGAAGDHPIMDGKKHRVPVEGGKAGALDGFYVGHLCLLYTSPSPRDRTRSRMPASD